jgi:gliding motility-associated-like protein
MRLHNIVILVSLLISGVVQGTHIIGGEIFYDKLAGDQYRVTLDLYRDCGPANTNNTGFDASITIVVYTANGVQFSSQSISYNGEVIVPVVIPNPCLTAPPNVCVATTRYETTFNLPPSAGGYTIVFQRCCRVPSILNLVQAGDIGLTCTVRVPGTPNTTNSSPRFVEYPPIVICVGEELVFNHSALDADGDSLSYGLCTPLRGGSPVDPAPVPLPPPYVPVPWATGYSANFQLDAVPPMSIDPITGQLSVSPTQQGAYAVGVCVQEYRNGVLIGESTRDFMFTVIVCDANIFAGISAQEPTSACSGLTQQFDNQSINGQFWSWDFGDPSTLADTSNMADPSWTYSAPGVYTVRLIANPGWPCADTSYADYEAFLPIDPSFVAPPYACGATSFTLQATGNFTPAASVVWDLGAAVQPSTATGVQVTADFPPDGVQPVSLTISENGCTETYSSNVSVFPSPTAIIPAQDQFCTGLTIAFGNDSQEATDYRWDLGDPTTQADTSLLPTPTWTYGQTGIYTVTLIAISEGPCTDTATAVFNVYIDLAIEFERPAIRCPNEIAQFVADGSFTSSAQVVWDFGPIGQPTSASGTSATSRFLPVGVHPVSVFVSENGCTGAFTDSVVVYPFPVADFSSDTRSCVGASFGFRDSSSAWTPLSYVWQFGDGVTSVEQEPIHQYAEPGIYTVTLTVSTNEGCIASDSLIRIGQVEVFPNPTAAFSALPREVSVFDPRIEVEDLSLNAVSWEYLVERNSFFSPDFSYSFEEGGQFEITLWVFSENGCPDSTTRMVFVSDHIFFAPNAFTPDGDGLNDTFTPVVIGAREYELIIFDRWGQVVFNTTDPKAYWSGENVHTGVYLYTARIKEWGALSKEYNGHISLLR